MIAAIPLTIIPLILFNILAYIWGPEIWDGIVFGITMLSGIRWILHVGDLMIVGALIILFLEVMKSARPGSNTIANHVLSTIVLIIYIVQFIVSGIAASSVYFILAVIALFDVVAGFSISIRTATRDIALSPHTIDGT